MLIETPDKIEIYCLPNSATCLCAGKNPQDMLECPICRFDPWGCICIPEQCENYGE